MNFKQQYLCGKCDFTYIDGCVELWHTRAEKDLDLTEYLGLTKEEYQIFLAQGNQALKDILDSQRVFRRFCIYQLVPTAKRKYRSRYIHITIKKAAVVVAAIRWYSKPMDERGICRQKNILPT